MHQKLKFKSLMLTVLIIVSICLITITLTYSFWLIKRSQSKDNSILGACLDLEFEDALENINGITINKANGWPISDYEGLNNNDNKYTFKVVNKCSRDVDYIIGIEDLLEATNNKFSYSSITVALDGNKIGTIAELETIDYGTGNPSKKLSIETVSKNGYNEHTFQIWINETSTIQEASNIFKTKLFVVAGQGIIKHDAGSNSVDIQTGESDFIIDDESSLGLSDESCFRVDSNNPNKVTFYNVSTCGTRLVLPPTINGNPVELLYLRFDISESLTYVNLENAIYLKEIDNGTFQEYVGTNQELVIPNSVTKIGNLAFKNFSGSNLVLSNNLTTIGYSAFYEYVGENKELIIPDSVTQIGDEAFYKFMGTNLVLGDNLTSIGFMSFENYKGTNQELIIPNNVETIGSSAFNSFVGTNLILSNNLVSIGAGAFQYYSGKNQELTIPDTVKTIDAEAFRSFSGTKLVLGNDLETIGTNTFMCYQGENQELVIPNNVTEIGMGAFRWFIGSKLTLGNKVRIISTNAFRTYRGLNQELIIPDSVISIGDASFSIFGGSSLTLGSGVRYIYTNAFSSYSKSINVNMSELEFESVQKSEGWKNANAELIFHN